MKTGGRTGREEGDPAARQPSGGSTGCPPFQPPDSQTGYMRA